MIHSSIVTLVGDIRFVLAEYLSAEYFFYLMAVEGLYDDAIVVPAVEFVVVDAVAFPDKE